MIDIQTKEELKQFLEHNYVKNRIQFSIRPKLDSKPKESPPTTPPASYNTNDVSQLKDYLDDKFTPKTFSNQLLSLIKVKCLNETDVYKAANIDRKLFSKIRHSEYHPSRKTAIALILAAHLSLTEASELLRLAGYALSKYEKADVVIAFCLTKQIYDIMLVNELLQEYANTSL
jgi:O-acetyl-ADP-ribose deacetylase